MREAQFDGDLAAFARLPAPRGDPQSHASIARGADAGARDIAKRTGCGKLPAYFRPAAAA